MAISPPRLYSDCRATAVYRHSLDTRGNRSDIYGLEGNGALLLFRREWKITSRNLFSPPPVKSARARRAFIRGRDNFRPARTMRPTTRLLTLSRRAHERHRSRRFVSTRFYGRLLPGPRIRTNKRARSWQAWKIIAPAVTLHLPESRYLRNGIYATFHRSRTRRTCLSA